MQGQYAKAWLKNLKNKQVKGGGGFMDTLYI